MVNLRECYADSGKNNRYICDIEITKNNIFNYVKGEIKKSEIV